MYVLQCNCLTFYLQGISQYLKTSIVSTTKNPRKVDIDYLLSRCKSNMAEFHLLQTPEILQLFATVLNNYWNKNFSFKEFVVPPTTTLLFAEMMLVVIRTWLERIGRSQEAEQVCTFTYKIKFRNKYAEKMEELLSI